jgi:SAM-dependent methyltransferase
VGPEDWDARYRDLGPPRDREPNRFLVEEVNGLEPGRALELGCGEGRNARWLAERGWRVTAVDFSPVALERARALAERRGLAVDWVRADARTFRAEPVHDLVALLYLQLPEAELARALAVAVGGLSPGGTLLVVGHDRANLRSGYGGPRDPRVLMTAEEVLPHLEGLRVERAGRVLRPVPLEDGEAVAVDTLVRARRA